MEKTKKATITFLGGVRSATGSHFLLESGTTKIAIDCGLFQGCKICGDKNREPFPYDPASVDVLFVTHAHLDHIGRIPKLVKDGFSGTIYSTAPTKDIADLMLIDSLGVLSKEAKSDKSSLIYTKEDVERTMGLWRTVSYGEEIGIKGGFSVTLEDSGHILGSAMIEVVYSARKIVFTGDLGNSPSPLLHEGKPVFDADYMVIESVYGDRNHKDGEERKYALERIIKETTSKKGVLMIPAFSIERTQELLFELGDLVESKKIPPVPVFLDSPLAIHVTALYKKYGKYFNEDVRHTMEKGDDIFKFPRLKFTLKTKESLAIKSVPNPKIIIAGSGMSNGGRIVRHEKLYLPDPNNTLLLVGYQAAGTPGREIQDGARTVNIAGDDVSVRARVVTIEGYSAHKDSDALLEFVARATPSLKKVFVVQGEPKSALFFVQRIRDYLGIPAIAPEEGERVELEF